MGSERVTGPPVGPKMVISVDVEGVGQLLRVDLDADKVACIAPADANDFGRFVARDESGRMWTVAGFEILLRETGRPVVVVDAFGAAPALWGKVYESVNLDADSVDAMGDRLTPAERDDVERMKAAPGRTAPLRRALAIVDRLAPPPPAPPPRAVVEAAEAAALGVIASAGLGGVPAPAVTIDDLAAAGLPHLLKQGRPAIVVEAPQGDAPADAGPSTAQYPDSVDESY